MYVSPTLSFLFAYPRPYSSHFSIYWERRTDAHDARTRNVFAKAHYILSAVQFIKAVVAGDPFLCLCVMMPSLGGGVCCRLVWIRFTIKKKQSAFRSLHSSTWMPGDTERTTK